MTERRRRTRSALRPSTPSEQSRTTHGRSRAARDPEAAAAGKTRLADPADFAAPGSGGADLLAHWDFAPGATLNAGVFNLADRKYWDWADVPGVAADSAVLDRYTRPGRNVGVSLAVSW